MGFPLIRSMTSLTPLPAQASAGDEPAAWARNGSGRGLQAPLLTAGNRVPRIARPRSGARNAQDEPESIFLACTHARTHARTRTHSKVTRISSK